LQIHASDLASCLILEAMKRTSLYPVHQRSGARLVEFGGWEMPLFYSGIIQEHLAVRQSAGIFDISHMGEFLISGPGSAAFLNHALTNDAAKLPILSAQYTLMCNLQGGVVDDTYLYRLERDKFLLVVNASRIEPDFAWLQNVLSNSDFAGKVELTNISDQMGAVAIQGPGTKEFIAQGLGCSKQEGVLAPDSLQKNQVTVTDFEGERLWVARTGYTGEDGFEVIGKAQLMPRIWDALLAAGGSHGLVPAGLGARDTLRTEMCYPLYGHELDESVTPIEAGLGFFVAFDKEEFVGRAKLSEQKSNGVERRLAAFRMNEKSAPPRPGYDILGSGEAAERIGKVTSGTQSPSLNCGIGLGYVTPGQAKPGTSISIDIRNKPAPARVVPKPIYRKVG
jgi:aminomethyltransferase